MIQKFLYYGSGESMLKGLEQIPQNGTSKIALGYLQLMILSARITKVHILSTEAYRINVEVSRDCLNHLSTAESNICNRILKAENHW